MSEEKSVAEERRALGGEVSREEKMERIKELVPILNQAAMTYYAEDREIMSNFEYDRLYDELVTLEQETGFVLSNSPTVRVGYEAVDSLPKERHGSPMLSLDKTKSREELRDWLAGHEGVLSWKLDGLTVVLTYEGGKLAKAVTRGNGEVGEVITANARTFINLPAVIPFQGTLVLRGEAVISYSDFEKINAKLPEEGEKYKNPRNLCSGSVRQLDSRITAERNVRFHAFSLVEAVETDGAMLSFHDSRMEEFRFLKDQGFTVVEHFLVTEATILDTIATFEKRIETYDIPSDGLVLSYENVAYGRSLGRTAKFPRHSIAFKWADELRETTLLEVEWSPSRTGLINPVAIFEPVELEGTTVSRASVHNVSVVRSLKLGIGDRITVYKANMIIPQISKNLTESDSLEIPATCPVCGAPTQIRQTQEAKVLYCTNDKCPAKEIGSFVLFVSRDAMNVDGLSEATLEKLVDKGFVKEFTDLFHLDQYREEIAQMEGFGEKSCQKLLDSVEAARNTTLPKVIYSLGIPNIGLSNAKLICKHFDYDLDQLFQAGREEVSAIDGIGDVIAASFTDYVADPENREKLERLVAELNIEKPQESGLAQNLAGLSFVVTGSLVHYGSRNELKDEIEARGGKVTGSVTNKTECLINNDVTSNSTKNQKAKELGVKILSEDEFLEKYFHETE
ncbi:MAG: NAD-dependent DNA ligase LigA [Lachnospiraceae bacterium]|nr:NAD-dependent DNA ligase LigA [Lachnospiraceae bacterium]